MCCFDPYHKRQWGSCSCGHLLLYQTPLLLQWWLLVLLLRLLHLLLLLLLLLVSLVLLAAACYFPRLSLSLPSPQVWLSLRFCCLLAAAAVVVAAAAMGLHRSVKCSPSCRCSTVSLAHWLAATNALYRSSAGPALVNAHCWVLKSCCCHCRCCGCCCCCCWAQDCCCCWSAACCTPPLSHAPTVHCTILNL